MEGTMSTLRSKVPALLAKKGWDAKVFAGHCMVAGMSADTAKRLADGDTEVRTSTLEVAAKVLGVKSIADILDIEPTEQ
jgi:hypothetical protein